MIYQLMADNTNVPSFLAISMLILYIAFEAEIKHNGERMTLFKHSSLFSIVYTYIAKPKSSEEILRE
jgi:hypothetical protein